MSPTANGSVTFTRFPLDVIASIAPGGVRIGVGVTVHLAPTYKCDVTAVCSEELSFDTGFGAIAQAAYSLPLSYTIALDFAARYTLIRYSEDEFNSLDGSSIGLFFGVRF